MSPQSGAGLIILSEADGGASLQLGHHWDHHSWDESAASLFSIFDPLLLHDIMNTEILLAAVFHNLQ